tara:strand:+ start:1413 stop:2099 length:687 start_codon:yes stop_codon:yes gene_type:complete
MIDFSVLIICSGLFLSAFTLSFAIVSQFVDHNILSNKIIETTDKFEYYYTKNSFDYSEVIDASNNDYIDGMYEEETPVGTVIMTYDNDTGVFNYYCNRFIPNKMLEVVCRGFVLKYECYNILVDYTEERINREAVLKKVLEKEENARKEKEHDNKGTVDVFAKMKSYNKKKSENTISNNDILIKTNFNKFKNCGRLENYTAIKKEYKTEVSNDCVYENISYKDFKKVP